MTVTVEQCKIEEPPVWEPVDMDEKGCLSQSSKKVLFLNITRLADWSDVTYKMCKGNKQ